MVNINTLKVIHREITDDYCSINYLAEQTSKTKPNIWHIIQLLKVMDLVDEKFSNEKVNVRVYKFKPNRIMPFSQFYEFYNQKVSGV